MSLLVASSTRRLPAIATVSLLSLALLGALGARLGGAPRVAAALRVTVGGSIAMLVTAAVGRMVGLAIGFPAAYSELDAEGLAAPRRRG